MKNKNFIDLAQEIVKERANNSDHSNYIATYDVIKNLRTINKTN